MWIVFTLLALSSCADDMQSIDLSHITFDGISVGDCFNRVETGNYGINPLSGKRKYEAIDIAVNGKEDCDSIADIVRVLGTEYHSSDYDAEQGLMQLRYRDKTHGIQCRFVFNRNTDLLVWGIAEKS